MIYYLKNKEKNYRQYFTRVALNGRARARTRRSIRKVAFLILFRVAGGTRVVKKEKKTINIKTAAAKSVEENLFFFGGIGRVAE